MKKSALAVAVLAPVMIDAAAMAQAVQWRVQDGGNGHWYQLIVEPSGLTWPVARQRARAIGGDLAALSRQGSTEFVQGLLSGGMCGGSTGQAGPYVGGFQDLAAADYVEPSGGWRWVDGSSFPGSAAISLDDSGGHQDYLHFISLRSACYGPFVLDDVGLVTNGNRSYVVEWSADCNRDGIVDHGQILAGQLADTDGNGVPDCCEGGATCCTADILVDGRVDGADLAAVLSHWGAVTGNSVSQACDLNRDGTVDGTDLGLLLAHWGPCGG